MSKRQDLSSKLAKARAYVAQLETQLSMEQPNSSALSTNDNRYQHVFDSLMEGCQIIGFDWRYLYVNNTAARHGQRTKDELLGHTMIERYPGIEKTPMFAVLQRCMQEHLVERIENEFTYPDGASAWFELNVQPVPEGIFILSLDITERKHAEENIRKLHRTLAVLSDINQSIVRIRHLPSLFEKACEIAVEKGTFQMAWIGLFDPKTSHLNPVTHAGISDSDLEKLIGTLNTHPLIGALRAGERLVSNDIQNDPMWFLWHEEALRLSYGATVVLPLIVANEIRGIFNLYAGETDFFDEQEMRLMDEMAMDISFAIEVNEQDQQRSQAETALRSSEEKYRSLIESAESSIALFDEHGVLLYANPIAANALSLTPEAAIGKQMQVLFPAAVAQYQLNGIRQVIHTGIGAVRESTSFTMGEDRWYRTSLQPVRDASGKVTATLINAVDITRLKQAEDDLRNERDKLEQKVVERTADLQAAVRRVEAILDNSPDATLLIEKDLSIQQTNSSFNTLFECEWNDYLDTSLLTLIHVDDADALTILIQRVMAEQEGQRIEIRALRKNGTIFDAELRIRLIQGDGLVCALHDITERKAQERQLRYHASLQQNVSDAIIVTDIDMRIQSWNKAAEHIYGWTAQEAIGKVGPEFLQIRFSPHQNPDTEFKQFTEQGFLRQETFQRRKDGTVISILGAATRLDDEKGVPVGIIAINHDITERKAQERQLRYHASIQESVSDAVIATDMDFRIQSWNHAAETIYGWSATEAIGKLANEILQTTYESEADRARILHDFLQHGAWQGEVIQHHQNGRPINILASANLFKDDRGQPIGIVSVNRDITELKQAQQVIIESEMRYRLLAENISDVIDRTNVQGIRTFITPSCYALLGYTPDELIGQSSLDIVHPDDRSDAFASVKQTVSEGKTALSFARRFLHKAGHHIWVEVTNNIIYDADTGKPVEIIGVIRDITERKRAEETLKIKMEEEHQLQTNLKALHEIIIELTAIDELDSFYKRVVELGRERLGFERLAMFLYDAQDGNAIGTFGTDTQANLVDERDVRFTPDPNGVMQRSFERIERFYFNEHTTLYNEEQPVGSGWNAAAVLWNGTQSLGWLVADNLLSHGPPSKPLLDTIGLYALSVGTLLAQKQTQIALRASEALYRLLADNISDLIVRSTLTSACLYISPSVRHILGYAPEELLGQPTFDFVHPEDKATIWEAYASAIERSDLIMTHQYRAKHKAGHYVWLETVGKPLFRDGTNEISEVITSSRDISERKQAEEALRQSQQMLFNVLENIPVLIFWKDRNSVYRGCNTRHAQAVGLASPDAITGKTDYDLFPDRAVEWEAEDREVMESDIPKMNIEELYTEVDGTSRWLRFNKVPLRSAEGAVIGVLVTIENITERKEAEDALRESEEKYRSLVETMRGGLVVFDTEFRVTYVNDRFCELLGYSREETIGKQPGDFVDATHIPLVQSHLERRQSAESTAYEVPLRHKHGHQIFVLLSGSPLLDQQGKYNGSLVVATDISIQKQAEDTLRQALAKEKELGDLKTRFVSMASHEFRTPLATILALAETLSAYRHKLPEEQIAERFEKIKEQVSNLKDIMEDVLLLARMQARRVEFIPVQFDLDNLCRSVLDEFQGQPDVTHVIEYTCDPVLQRVRLDKKLMRQVINNLITNAIKYSPSNKTIRVNLSYVSNALVLTISDQGIGIPEADLGHLFEPFHRAANVGAISGTGLGLVIIKEAVELHRGTISVKSQLDVGTIFTVHIPLSIEEEPGNDKNSGD